jgi:hypothetical protein
MTQTTLGDYADEKTVPDDVLEWANRFKHARKEPIPRVEEARSVADSRAKSAGFDPKGWRESAYHGENADYHRDDRRDPTTPADEKAHAYAETHRP